MADTSDQTSGPPHLVADNVRPPAPGTAYAVVASDFDGDQFLVALTEQVEDWVVEVETPEGTAETMPRETFVGGWYPGLHGRPAWWVDRRRWRLHIAGVRITLLEPLPDRTVSPVDRHQGTPSW